MPSPAVVRVVTELGWPDVEGDVEAEPFAGVRGASSVRPELVQPAAVPPMVVAVAPRRAPRRTVRRDTAPRLTAMLATSVVDAASADRADHGRVAVAEEQRLAGVERGDAGHLLVGELEVEDVKVLGHAIRAHRLGDGDDAALEKPAKHDLCD